MRCASGTEPGQLRRPVRTFDYLRPDGLDEALRLARELPDARFVAGGTDLLVAMRAGEVRAPAVISLNRLDGLRVVELDGDRLRIGALTPVADLVEDPAVTELAPVLAAAAARLGGPSIRNVATVGGNLCNASPCADTATPLLVLDARVVLRGLDTERELPLAEFFVGPGQTRLEPGELLTHVVVDRPAPGTAARFRKRGRVRMDLAIASAAVLLQLDGALCRRARVAVGSVAPVPLRLPAVEALLEGATVDEALVEQVRAAACDSVQPIDDVRSTAAYRRALIGVYVARAVRELALGGGAAGKGVAR